MENFLKTTSNSRLIKKVLLKRGFKVVDSSPWHLASTDAPLSEVESIAKKIREILSKKDEITHHAGRYIEYKNGLKASYYNGGNWVEVLPYNVHGKIKAREKFALKMSIKKINHYGGGSVREVQFLNLAEMGSKMVGSNYNMNPYGDSCSYKLINK